MAKKKKTGLCADCGKKYQEVPESGIMAVNKCCGSCVDIRQLNFISAQTKGKKK